MIINSKGVNLDGNVVADFHRHGVWAKSASALTINNNWVFHVVNSVTDAPVMRSYHGWLGGFTLSESVSTSTVTGNVVAGTWHHGFHVVPQACDDANPDFLFTNNVAHSISGYGAVALNVE